MNAFLWTVAAFGLINTMLVLFCAVRGQMPEVTPTSRAIDAVLTFGVGAWALWLLAKGA